MGNTNQIQWNLLLTVKEKTDMMTHMSILTTILRRQSMESSRDSKSVQIDIGRIFPINTFFLVSTRKSLSLDHLQFLISLSFFVFQRHLNSCLYFSKGQLAIVFLFQSNKVFEKSYLYYIKNYSKCKYFIIICRKANITQNKHYLSTLFILMIYDCNLKHSVKLAVTFVV